MSLRGELRRRLRWLTSTRFMNRLLIALLDNLVALKYRATSHQYKLGNEADDDLVVCMTSYPERIGGAWISLESLFRQHYRSFRLVLVLAEGQFPGRKVPRSIQRLVSKGLEIIWVERDGGSFDHLWPAYVRYPSASVISVDDDKFFPPGLVGDLKSASIKRPSTIIGWRGWRMTLADGELRFGDGWERATRATASSELFMPPGNGSLYPPGSLPAMTGDYNLRETVCPNADDVWYWAMARQKGTPSFCMGRPNHRAVWQQSKSASLAALQPGPTEFRQVLEHFQINGLTGE